MGRRKNAPQKKYATQWARTASNKARNYLKNGGGESKPRGEGASAPRRNMKSGK